MKSDSLHSDLLLIQQAERERDRKEEMSDSHGREF